MGREPRASFSCPVPLSSLLLPSVRAQREPPPGRRDLRAKPLLRAVFVFLRVGERASSSSPSSAFSRPMWCSLGSFPRASKVPSMVAPSVALRGSFRAIPRLGTHSPRPPLSLGVFGSRNRAPKRLRELLWRACSPRPWRRCRALPPLRPARHLLSPSVSFF